jgi:tripartite-type tricarboxylate transporter receptor subunit TctC
MRLVVGFAAGSGSDTIARLIAPRLAATLGQSMVVENRAGAGGAVAADAIAKAPADGSTSLLVPSGQGTLAAMRKMLPFRPVADFTWVSTVTTYPFVIAVVPTSPYRTLADVVRVAGSRNMSSSSVGLGTAHHLIGEWINAEAGVNRRPSGAGGRRHRALHAHRGHAQDREGVRRSGPSRARLLTPAAGAAAACRA